MSYVRHEFRSSTRAAMGAFLHASYGTIPEPLLFDKPNPFSVAAVGREENLGKTFVWDTGTEKLLGESARMRLNVSMMPQEDFTKDIDRYLRGDLFNRTSEPDLKTKQRVLEIWEGQHQASSRSLRILFANLHNWYYATYDLEENNIANYLSKLTSLPREQAREWCDVVVTSRGEADGTSIVYDLSRPEGSVNNWDRKIVVETRDQDLLETSSYQQLMEQHCTLL